MPNGIGKLNATIRQVSNAVTKSVKYLLPPLTVVANVADVVGQFGTDPALVGRVLEERNTGYNISTGGWSGDQAAKGAGSLIVSAGVSKVLSMLGL